VRCVRLMRNSGEAGEAGNWMQQTEVWVPVIVAIAELIARSQTSSRYSLGAP
jgi:hypothetical protein